MPEEPPISIYGLSTEGYSVARRMAMGGARVFIIDESTPSAIPLGPEIASTYPDIHSLKEDEPLLSVKSVPDTIAESEYLFFAPTIRRTGHDTKNEVRSKFKDAISPMSRDSTVVYNIPVGFGGNGENIALLEYVTGFEVGVSASYHYYPLSLQRQPRAIGSHDGKADPVLNGLLNGKDAQKPFVTIPASEYFHAMDVLTRFSSICSTLEICRLGRGDFAEGPTPPDLQELYLDEMVSWLYDLRFLGASFEGANNLMYLINGSGRIIEGYMKRLVDTVKGVLKRENLKASKTRLLLLWTLDGNAMRGEKIEIKHALLARLRDYIGDISTKADSDFELFHSEKTIVIIACSKPDYEYAAKRKNRGDLIVIRANPLCEVTR